MRVAEIVVDTLKSPGLKYPTINQTERAQFAEMRVCSKKIACRGNLFSTGLAIALDAGARSVSRGIPSNESGLKQRPPSYPVARRRCRA
ncbi:MAG: hypothetical protein M3329_00960 [Pseudomonadota bacterium]|nr:hypothetical protein [Pseudomonadota bacterium]